MDGVDAEGDTSGKRDTHHKKAVIGIEKCCHIVPRGIIVLRTGSPVSISGLAIKTTTYIQFPVESVTSIKVLIRKSRRNALFPTTLEMAGVHCAVRIQVRHSIVIISFSSLPFQRPS